jgi:hypothetical protein
VVASNLGGAGESAGNTGAPDLHGAFSSLGYNLLGRTDGSSGFTNGVNGDIAGSASAPVDPVLGPLADNGGPTFTMALLHGSPALDAGADALLHEPYWLRNDQRGFHRQSGSHVDIGAFESKGRVPGHALILSGTLSPRGNLQLDRASEPSAFDAVGRRPGLKLIFNNNSPGATFTVLATTNLSLPFHNWSVVGQALQIAPGQFEFTDPETSVDPERFYGMSSP